MPVRFTFRFKHIGEISVLTLVSRILGQIRSTLLGALLSTSLLADSFMIALKLPNFLRGILSEGAANAAFIPLLSETQAKKNHAKSPTPSEQHMFTFLFTLTVLAVVFVTLGGIFLAPTLTQLLYQFAYIAADESLLSREKLSEHTALLMQIMFPYLITISLSSLMTALLHTHGKFKLTATLPIVFNVVFITALCIALYFEPAPPLSKLQKTYILSFAVLCGGIIQLLIVTIGIKTMTRIKLRFKFSSVKKTLVHKLSKLLAPITGSSLLHQLQLLLLDPIALSLGAGGVTALFFSNRLLEFPLAILVYPILTAAFPDFSRYVTTSQAVAFQTTLKRSLSLIVLATLLATSGGLLVHESIVSLVFGFGAFKEESIALTAKCLFFHLMGLPFIAINRLLAQALYAMQKGSIIVKITAFALVTSVGSALVFTWLSPHVAMIALGATTANILMTLAYALVFQRTPLRILTSFSLPRYLLKQLGYYGAFFILPTVSVYLLREPIALALDALQLAAVPSSARKLFELGDILLTFTFLGLFSVVLLTLAKDQETLRLLTAIKNRWNR